MADVYTWQEGTLWGVLNDDLRVRLNLCDQAGGIWIGVDARLWDDRTDQANYTHDDFNRYQPDEITITDEGLLTALHRHITARTVEFRSGFTVRVPQAFIAPLRAALAELSKALREPLRSDRQPQGVH